MNKIIIGVSLAGFAVVNSLVAMKQKKIKNDDLEYRSTNEVLQTAMDRLCNAQSDCQDQEDIFFESLDRCENTVWHLSFTCSDLTNFLKIWNWYVQYKKLDISDQARVFSRVLCCENAIGDMPIHYAMRIQNITLLQKLNDMSPEWFTRKNKGGDSCIDLAYHLDQYDRAKPDHLQHPQWPGFFEEFQKLSAVRRAQSEFFSKKREESGSN